MKDIKNKLIQVPFLVILTFLFPLTSLADTFTNIETGEELHGYATSKTEDGKKMVQTSQKGPVALNMTEWKVTADRQGRNNKVVVITFDRMIMYEIETAAMQEALAQAADAGPLFILIMLDTPGGRLDLTQKLCAAVTETGQTEIVCFVNGGEHGGAISAGAALALACDKIYMATNTVIGGATVITVTSKGGPTSVKKAYGEEVGEKFSSIWQASLASLAEKNGRPGLLAKAMVDKDIEVIEVADSQKRLFINPVNKNDSQKLVKTWSQKDSLLTLTAKEALGCTIADAIVDSQAQLLRDLKAADAEIVTNKSIQQASKELSRAQLRVKRLREKIDRDIKQLQQAQKRARGMSLVKKVRASLRQLLVLARQYPDLQLDTEGIENEYNSVEAFYQQFKRVR